MKQYVKRFFIFCVISLILCMTGTALADELSLVDEDRIVWNQIDGISMIKDDGWLRLTIDTEDTDWEKLLHTSYDEAMSMVILPLGITAPSDVEAETFVCTDFRYRGNTPPAEVFDAVLTEAANNNEHESGNAYWFLEIARYIQTTSMMQPSTIYSDYHFSVLCRWFNAADETVYSEQLNVEVNFTSTGMFKVDRRQTDDASIQAGLVYNKNTEKFEQLSADVLTISTDDGSVLYEIEDVADISSQYEARITTIVAVPQSLVNSGVAQSDWWCINNHISGSSSMEIEGDAAAGYYIRLTLPIPDENGQIESQNYSFSWGYQDKTVDYGQLSIRIVTGDPLPWPAYVTEWQIVPEDRMNLIKFASLQDSMDITYSGESGVLHFGRKGSTLPSAEDLENANYKPVVQVPDGATAYSTWHITMSELYGSQFTAEYQQEMENALNKLSKRHTVSDSTSTVTLDGSNLFMVYHPSTSGVASSEAAEILEAQSVYLPADMTGECAGTVRVIYWYENEADTDPFLIEYMIDTRDEFVLVQETEASVELPDESVTVPVFLIDSAHEKTNCYLIINTYPQEDGNYVYYELQLIYREDGQPDTPVALDPSLTYRLHIPYPKGMNQNSENVTFIIRHLNQNHEVTEIFDEGGYGSIERTETGLIITIKSLSPFELVWYTPETPNVSVLPQTGDNSQHTLWLLLTVISFVALMITCKFKENGTWQKE